MPVKQLLSCAAFLSAAVLYTSCGGGKSGEENAKNDSTQTAGVLDPTVEKLLPLFAEAKTLPYTMDTLVMNHMPKDTLVGEQVKQLQTEWFKHSFTDGIDYQLKEFYTIDSAKAAGGYEKWAEKLDIGMTKKSDVYPLHKIKIDEKTWMLTWALEYSSYEACPYSSGVNVYATLVYDGKLSQSTLLGESMGAGDPPVSMNRLVTAELTGDGKIAIHEFEESDDMDAEFSTQTKNEYWFEIKDGKFALVKEEKGKEVAVPHPVATEE